MKRRFLTILTLGLVLFSTVLASGVVLSRFEARTLGSDIEVLWQASDETSLKEYVLERKTRFDIDYKPVRNFQPLGVNRPYLYRDSNVYKDKASELVRYRLRIMNQDGSFTLVSAISVNYFPTAIRRTWGSIKAMFQ